MPNPGRTGSADAALDEREASRDRDVGSMRAGASSSVAFHWSPRDSYCLQNVSIPAAPHAGEPQALRLPLHQAPNWLWPAETLLP